MGDQTIKIIKRREYIMVRAVAKNIRRIMIQLVEKNIEVSKIKSFE